MVQGSIDAVCPIYTLQQQFLYEWANTNRKKVLNQSVKLKIKRVVYTLKMSNNKTINDIVY